jgi:hypothetical protein
MRFWCGTGQHLQLGQRASLLLAVPALSKSETSRPSRAPQRVAAQRSMHSLLTDVVPHLSNSHHAACAVCASLIHAIQLTEQSRALLHPACRASFRSLHCMQAFRIQLSARGQQCLADAASSSSMSCNHMRRQVWTRRSPLVCTMRRCNILQQAHHHSQRSGQHAPRSGFTDS